jgi:hypothetical protein
MWATEPKQIFTGPHRQRFIGDRFRCDLRDVEGRGTKHLLHKRSRVTQILGARTTHQSGHVLKMGLEGGYQRVPFGVGHTDRLAYSMLQAKQYQNLCQPTSSRAKLTLLPPAGTGSVTSKDGFVCCGETQHMLAQPSAKPIGHAHVPPDSLWWILLLVEGLGDRRQVLRQWPRL